MRESAGVVAFSRRLPGKKRNAPPFGPEESYPSASFQEIGRVGIARAYNDFQDQKPFVPLPRVCRESEVVWDGQAS